MNNGKVTLREVGSKSKEIEFTEKDPWVVDALKEAAPHKDLCGKNPDEWALSSVITGRLLIERLDPEYSLSGSFEARLPLLCPRCGTEGTVGREGTFRVFLKPQGPQDEADEGDDPDYLFLETPYIDLPRILTEQIVALEPVVEYPDLELSGQAHGCSAGDSLPQELDVGNENHLSSGQNEGKARNSPFAILGKLKVSQDSKKKSKE